MRGKRWAAEWQLGGRNAGRQQVGCEEISELYRWEMGGRFVRETFPVYDPSTEEVIAEVASASAADVDRAVKAARAAFDSGPWAATTAQERGAHPFQVAEKGAAELRTPGGNRIAQFRQAHRGSGIRHRRRGYLFRVLRGHGHQSSGPCESRAGERFEFTLREPVGVAGQIVPWNYPLVMASWKLAPALAAGCCCVLKPAEQSAADGDGSGRLVCGAGRAAGCRECGEWNGRSCRSGAGGAPWRR